MGASKKRRDHRTEELFMMARACKNRLRGKRTIGENGTNCFLGQEVTWK